MKKRILALVLTLAMLLSLFPGQVFAAQTAVAHTEHNYEEVPPETQPPTEDGQKAPVKSTQAVDSIQDLLNIIDYDAAVEDLEYLTRTIGTRPTGSIGEHMAAEYVDSVFEELGYETTIQKFPTTKNGYWPGTMGEVYLGDLTLSAFTPTSNTYYTAFGHAEGTAVYLDDPANVASLGSDLSGKIVFYPGNWRSGKDPDTISCMQALDAAGAEAIVILLDLSVYTAEADQKWFPTLSLTASTTVSTPVLLCNAYEHERVPAYLAQNPGITASVDCRDSDIYTYNTVGVKKAAVETDWTVYVCGHMDSVMPGSGTNDNASGTVGVLALARAFQNVETNYNIVFITLGAEEIGLEGSEYFVRNMTAEEKDHVIGVYNMDMIATSYPGCDYIYMMVPTNDFSLTDNVVENRVVLSTYRAAEELGYDMNYVVAQKEWASDHSSFNDGGMPAVGYILSTTPTSLNTEHVYHTINDNMDNISRDRLEKSVDLVATAVYNDATAEFVAYVGEGKNREYYTSMDEAKTAARAKGTKAVPMVEIEVEIIYPQLSEDANLFLSELDYEAMEADLTYLTKEIGIRVAGTQAERDAQDYVLGIFEELGYETSLQEFNTRSNGVSTNAIGVKKAAVETDLSIYITAHIDTVNPSPGANDNGSGVVGMLGLARALADVDTNYNIVFISCGAEETGKEGSYAFAQAMTEEQRANAICDYNLDMIATSQEDVIYIMMMTSDGKDNHASLMAREAALSLEYSDEQFHTCQGTPADHDNFHKVGIPAVQFFRLKSNNGFNYSALESNYHKASDNMNENFSITRLQEIMDAVGLAVYNDATADYVAVVGEGTSREYYTTVAEAMSASIVSGGQVTLLSTGEVLTYSHSHKNSDGTTTTVSKALLADMVPGGQTVTLESGHYFLPEDVTTNVTFEIKGDVEICLNGRTLTFDISSGDTGAQNGGFYVNGGTLIIDDTCSTGAGRITASVSSTGENLAPIRVSGNGSLTLDTVRVDTTARVRSTKKADTGSNGQEESAIIVEAGSTATIDQSNLSGSEYGIWNQGTVTVNGGNIDGGTYGIKNEGTLSVENCYIGYGRTAVQYAAGEAVFIPFLEGTTAATTSAWNGGIHGCTFNIDHTRGILYGNITLDDPYVPMGSNILNYVIKSEDILEMRQMTSGLKEDELKNAEESWKTDDEFIHNVESFWVTTSNTSGYHANYGREGDMIHNTGIYQTVVYPVYKSSGQLVGATLRRLRVDPVATHETLTAGYFEYDYVYFGPENRSPAAIMASVDKADYGVYNTQGSTFNLGSHVEIYGSDTDIYLGKGVVVATSDAVATPEDGNISVKTEADPAVAAVKLTSGWPAGKDQSVITYIPSHNEGEDCSVTLKDAELYIVSPNSAEHTHCVYGEVCPDKKAGNTCTHTKVLFDTPVDNTNFATVLGTPGRYYLTEDIELTGQFGFRGVPDGSDIYLCLNGFSITSTNQLNIANNTKVYLCNCRRTDVAGSGTCYIDRAVLKYGELHLHSGTLSMSADGASNVDSSGKLVIDGGTFTANTGHGETNVYAAYESTVNPTDAYIILKSGRVENLGSESSAVCHIGYGYLTMNGDIELAGSEAFGDIWLFPNVSDTPCLITLEEGFAPNGKVYTVRWGYDSVPAGLHHQITSGWGALCNSIGYIPFEGVKGFAIIEDYDANGNKELFIVREEEKENFKTHEHCVYGENCEYTKEGKPCEHSKVGFVTPLDGTNFVSSINASGFYYLLEDVALNSTLDLNCGGEIYLCLNGHRITGNQMLVLSGSTKLYLCNCKREKDTDGTFYIQRATVDGQLWLHSGNLIMNSTSSSTMTYGKFVIDGGNFIADPGTGTEEANIYVNITVSQAEIILRSGSVVNYGANGAAACHAGTGHVIMDGDISLTGGSAVADIWLFPATNSTPLYITIREGFDPKGQVYTVRQDVKTLGVREKYQLTSGWGQYASHLDYIPFECVRGYEIVELEENGTKELYMIRPEDHAWFVPHYHYLDNGEVIYYDQKLTLEMWNSFGGTIPAGAYVLVDNIETGSGMNIPANSRVDICLCGKNFKLSGQVRLNDESVLRIDDCTDSGETSLNGERLGKGSLSCSDIYMIDTTTFKKVSIANGTVSTSNPGWVPVYMYGTLEITGGVLNVSGAYGIDVHGPNVSEFYIRGGVINSTTYGFGMDSKLLVMSGSPVINSAGADILLYKGYYITFENGMPLNPPAGETYVIELQLHNGTVTAGEPVRITDGWKNSGLASTATESAKIPFVNSQGYIVKEMTVDGVTELYLAIPEVTVAPNITGGTVAVNPAGGLQDTTITVTATPNQGKVLRYVTYSYFNGTETVTQLIEATKDDNGNYVGTFAMPAADAIVTAYFGDLHIHDGVSFETLASVGGKKDIYPILAQGGRYVLDGDGEFGMDQPESGTMTLSKEVYLCLNGRELEFNQLYVTGKLYICNCTGHGKLDMRTMDSFINLNSSSADVTIKNVTIDKVGGDTQYTPIYMYAASTKLHLENCSFTGASQRTSVGVQNYIASATIKNASLHNTGSGTALNVEVNGFTLSGYNIFKADNNADIKIWHENGHTSLLNLTSDFDPAPNGKIAQTYTLALDATARNALANGPVQITSGWSVAKSTNSIDYIPFVYYDETNKNAPFASDYIVFEKGNELYVGLRGDITVETEGEGSAVAKDEYGKVITYTGETATVKIDATPAEGHFAGRLVLTYMEGETQVTKELAPNAQGDFEFAMPAVDVTAKVYFYKTHIHTLADGTEIVYDKVLTQAVYNTTSAGSGLVGAYLLLEDIITNGRMNTTYGQRTDICLCGHTITAGNLYFSSYSTVRIDDCTDSGEKTPDGKPIAKGTLKCTDGVTMYNITGATFIFANGTLIANDNSCCFWMDGTLYITGGKVITSGSPGIDCYTAGTSEWHIQNGIITATGEYVVGMDSKKLVLSGSPILTGGQYDIKLYYGYHISFEDGKPLNPPAGETYSIKLFNKTPTAEEPVPITKDWQYSGLASTATQAARPPFVSVQGYAVREINGELYLVIPELTTAVNDSNMGSASSDVLTGVQGTPAVITATPASKLYYVDSVVLTYWNGAKTVTEELEFTTDENGVATANLTMPAADATVTVNFKKYHVHTMSVDCSVSDNEEENIVFATELNQDNIGSYKSGHVLADGYYVLTSDITIDMIYLNSYAYICLNGHTITSTHSTAGFETQDSRSLYICDCSSDKTGGITTTNSNMLLWSFAGPMHVYGGNYNGTSSYGLYVRNAVHFYDGNVYGKDYGACLESGTLTIAGGTITSDDMGIEFYGGTLKLSGSPVINGKSEDIYLYNGRIITISELLTPPDGETYSVRLDKDATKPTVGHPIQITEGFHENGNTYNCFTSADPNYFTYVRNGEVYLGVKANITVQTEGEGTAVAKDAKGNVISMALETETVKIDATPAEGYTVAKVVLSYMEGETEVRKLVSIDDDGMYGFPMPGVEATVTVTFREKHIHTLADGSTIVYDTFVDQEVWDSIRGSVPEGNYVLVDHVSGHCSLKSNSYINICLCGYNLNATGSETKLYTGTTLRIDDCTPDDELLGTISMPQVYGEGPGHIIIADGIYHGYGSIASIALKGGSFTMEGGYFISDASSGMALGSQVAGISDFSILGGSLKCTTGMVLEGDCGKIVLGGDLAITGKDYDIRFYPGYLISFDKDYPLNPPTGETYILHLASGSVTAEQPVQLTSGWENSGLASTATTEAKIPFVSAQGYAVREITDENGVTELYLAIPELTVEVNDPTKGSVEPANASGKEGTSVVITATPATEEQVVYSVVLTYWDGAKTVTQKLPYTKNDDGNFVVDMTMPAADCTVTVNFMDKHKHPMSVDCETGDIVEFDKILDENISELPEGNYVLMDDISVTSNLTINGRVNLCLNGHKMTFGTNEITVNGVLNICDCSEHGTGSMNPYKIKNNVGAYLRIYGGTITTDTTTEGYMLMAGGSLIESSQSKLIVHNKGELVITGGYMKPRGPYGVYSYSSGSSDRVLRISGGKIDGGSTTAIYVGNTEFHFRGAPELTAKTDIYLASKGQIVILDGAVNGGPYTVNGGKNTYFDGSAPFLVTDNWEINATYPVPFVSAKTNNSLDYSIGILKMNGETELYFVGKHDHKLHVDSATIEFVPINFVGKTLESGSYVLYEDVTADQILTINGDVKLCLNGHTLDMATSHIYVTYGSTLNICDCSEGKTGTITGSPESHSIATNPYLIENSGTVRLYSGNITSDQRVLYNVGNYEQYEGTLTSTHAEYVIDNGNTGYMKLVDGTISGVKAIHNNNGEIEIKSGSITASQFPFVVDGGTLSITGGEIKATGTSGAAIVAKLGAEVTLTGGKIINENPTGGHAIRLEGCTFNLSGKPEISAHYADFNLNAVGQTITVAGKIEGTYTVRTLAVPEEGRPVQITTDWYLYENMNGDYPFGYYTDAYPVAEMSAENGDELFFVKYHQHYMSNTPNSEAALPDGSTPEYVKFDKVIDSVETLNSYLVDGVLPSGSYVLLDNITYDGILTIGGDVDFCLNGYTFTLSKRENKIDVQEDATLNICDCSEEHTGKITKTASETGGGMLIDFKGDLNIYGGKLDAVYGCAVSSTQMETATRVFSMYGGTLTGTGSPVVTLQNADMYLYDGTISTASVAVNASGGSKVIMNGGNITSTGSGIATSAANEIYIYGGNITSNGAGVTVGSLSKLDMSGGTIDSKSTGVIVDISNDWNGEVHTFHIGEFIMTGGSVTGTSCGIDAKGNVTLNGGTVTGATALKLTSDVRTYKGEYLIEFGGKVILNDGVLNGNVHNEADIEVNGGIINGTVTNTTRNQTFVGLPHTHEGVFVMNGGTINGGDYAVYHQGGEFAISGAVELNSSVADVYLATDKTIAIGENFVAPTEAYTVKPEVSPTDGNYVKFTTGWSASPATNGMGNYPFTYVGETEGVLIWKFRDSAEEPSELYFVVRHMHGDFEYDIPLNEAMYQTILGDTAIIPSGKYYLTEDFHVADGFTLPNGGSTIYLCLNGHTISGDGAVQDFFANQTNLYICDCDGNGHYYTKRFYLEDSNVYFQGGTLHTSRDIGTSLDNSNFYLQGGTLIGSNIKSDYAVIWTEEGFSNITLTSGKLENTGNGYVVANLGSGKVILNGTVEMVETEGYADFYLSTEMNSNASDPVLFIESTFAPNGEVYTVFVKNAETKITLDKPYRLTDGWTNVSLGYIPFESTQGYEVVELFCEETDQLELYLIVHEHCVYGANCEDIKAGNECSHEKIWFNQALDQKLMEEFNRSSDGVGNYVNIPTGNYFLTNDIDMSFIIGKGGLRFQDEATVYLCLNGHSITELGEISVTGNAKVYICDCKNDPETGENQGRIDVGRNKGNVWVGLDNSAVGGSLFHHGGTINVVDSSYNPLNVWDGGDFVLDGGTYVVNGNGGGKEAIYGYWNYNGNTKGPYPKLTFKSGTIKHMGTNWTIAQFGDSYVTLSGTVKIENDNAREDADFYLKPEVKKEMTVLTITETFDPQGEVYSVYLDAKLDKYGGKFRITDGWHKVDLDMIPFISVQGYMVVEMLYNGNPELYLVKPKADAYLWQGHDVAATGTQLFGAMYSYEAEYLTEIGDWTFAVSNVELKTQNLPVAVNGDRITFDADVSGGYGGEAWITIEQVDKESGAVLKTERLDVSLNVHVYDVKDSVYVLDYAAPVKLDKAVFTHDTMPGVGQGSSVKFETYGKTKPVLADDGLSMTVDPLIDLKGVYGLFTVSEDGTETVYTPNAMLDGKEEVYMIFRVHRNGVQTSAVGSSDPFKEIEMYKTITLVPANVVYYEDTNEALVWGTEGSKISITPVGESSVGYQDGEINDEHGNDPGYAYDPGVGDDGNVGTYVGSGGTHKEIVINGAGTILQFTFTGTAFDVIGRTNASSGTIRYRVYQDNKQLYNGLVDTAYQGDIYQVPLLHKEMEYGTYTVKLEAVVEYNWDYEGEWTNYDPNLGIYLPPVKTAYLWLDGVRIYNPLAMTDKDREHYNNDGEETARFVEIRELIRDGKGASVSFTEEGVFKVGAGSIFYLETAQKGAAYTGNSTTNGQDYLVAGPNNELYFNSAKQAAVLYVKAEDATKATMLQVGIRKLNSGAFGTAGTPGVMSLGMNNGKEILVSTEKSIGYSEQYYTVDLSKCETEVIGGETYFRVVISAMGGAPFVMTNLKYSNLVFAKIPEVQDTVDFGETTEVNYSLPNLPRLARQLRMAYDMLPEDEMVAEDQELAFVGVSLNLHSSIAMNIYVDEAILEGYEDPYVLVEKQHGDRVVYETTKAVPTGKKMIGSMSCLNFYYPGITSKEMSATVRLTLYAWKDGVLTRGVSIDYGILTYAKNTLSKNNNPTLRTMLVDMLNYGAEAQIYWDYHTEFLANSTLTEAEKALATVQEPVLVDGSIEDDPSIPGSGSYPYSIIGASLLLMDKVEINYFLNAGEGDFSGKKLVITYVDASGKDVKREIPAQAFTHVADTYYKVTFDGLNAKDMRVPVTCWIADEKEERLSNALTYSIESYAASYSGEGTLRELLMDMMRYGDAAHAYFTTRKNG